LSAEGSLLWRKRFMAWLEEIVALYPPRVPVDLQALADHFGVIADGGIVWSRIYEDKLFIGRQARMFHDLVKALFQPVVRGET